MSQPSNRLSRNVTISCRALLIAILSLGACTYSLLAENKDTNEGQSYVESYPNGQKRMEATLRNGVKEGLWTEYSPDGEKLREMHFGKGKLEGPFKIWFPDGKVRHSRFPEELFPTAERVKFYTMLGKKPEVMQI